MVRRFLLCLALCAIASGQSMQMVRNDAVPTNGADIATFQRNVTHFTFDLQGNTGASDWLGSEISVDVIGVGSIWHATNQRIAELSCPPGDPNCICYIHNLNAPGVRARPPFLENTLLYDTFFTAPGLQFTVDPSFDSPGPPHDPMHCPPSPPIVSHARRIHGLNTLGEPIPLRWYDTDDQPLLSTTLARLTFQVPQDHGMLVLDDRLDEHPPPGDLELFATFRGRIDSAAGSSSEFAFDIYQAIPEPGTLAALMLTALVAVAGRRR